MLIIANIVFILFYLQVEPVSICVSSIKLSITHLCHSFSATQLVLKALSIFVMLYFFFVKIIVFVSKSSKGVISLINKP